MAEHRIERDTLGEVKVPAESYYGAQTQRAVENFPVSGVRLPAEFVKAQAVIKWAAARTNMEAGILPPDVGAAIVRAAEEVMAGGLSDQFVVDVFQAGAGTSQNMNMNEVLANRAGELLGGRRGEYRRVHPNDHVNMAQSTNDTIHAAIHIAAVLESSQRLEPAVHRLEESLARAAARFDPVIKCGRTHLQDAVPIRLGQEFGAYAAMIRSARVRVTDAARGLEELCLGGTAVGTGLNTPPGYPRRVVKHVSGATGHAFRSAENLVEAMMSFGAVVDYSSALRGLAGSLKKIADDLRLLSSGPRTGLGEIRLPAVQPGSSIMPGKVNPVLPEMLNMVCTQVMGCDAAVIHASQAGQLELNVMMPVIGYNLLFAIRILSNGLAAFTAHCLDGIEAEPETCLRYAEASSALATALSPAIGYHRAAELAQRAVRENTSVRALAEREKLLPADQLSALLDLRRMTEPPPEKN